MNLPNRMMTDSFTHPGKSFRVFFCSIGFFLAAKTGISEFTDGNIYRIVISLLAAIIFLILLLLELQYGIRKVKIKEGEIILSLWLSEYKIDINAILKICIFPGKERNLVIHLRNGTTERYSIRKKYAQGIKLFLENNALIEVEFIS